MSIMDTAAKIVKSFKPFEVKVKIKKPIINYKNPTHNLTIQSGEISSSQLNIIAEKISEKIIEEIKRLK